MFFVFILSFVSEMSFIFVPFVYICSIDTHIYCYWCFMLLPFVFVTVMFSGEIGFPPSCGLWLTSLSRRPCSTNRNTKNEDKDVGGIITSGVSNCMFSCDIFQLALQYFQRHARWQQAPHIFPIAVLPSLLSFFKPFGYVMTYSTLLLPNEDFFKKIVHELVSSGTGKMALEPELVC